jgi:hypothetical protein
MTLVTEWLLVLTAIGVSVSSPPAVTVVPVPFENQETCIQAGRVWEANIRTQLDFIKVVATCIPRSVKSY